MRVRQHMSLIVHDKPRTEIRRFEALSVLRRTKILEETIEERIPKNAPEGANAALGDLFGTDIDDSGGNVFNGDDNRRAPGVIVNQRIRRAGNGGDKKESGGNHGVKV